MQYIITAILLISTFFVSLASAYTLDDTDYSLTTLAEEKLITLAEQQDHRNLSIIIYLLEHIQHEATLSERKEEILAYIIDSIYRHTGYDADGNPYVLNTHDCYEDEYFDEEDQQCYLIDENYTETDTDFGYDTVYIQHEDNQEEILASYITKDTLRLVE
jgi:galactose-1-phosphate uridylyltransferase